MQIIRVRVITIPGFLLVKGPFIGYSVGCRSSSLFSHIIFLRHWGIILINFTISYFSCSFYNLGPLRCRNTLVLTYFHAFSIVFRSTIPKPISFLEFITQKQASALETNGAVSLPPAWALCVQSTVLNHPCCTGKEITDPLWPARVPVKGALLASISASEHNSPSHCWLNVSTGSSRMDRDCSMCCSVFPCVVFDPFFLLDLEDLPSGNVYKCII